MRVKIVGKKSISELREYLDRFVNQAERLGITHVTATNIYFSPVNEHGEDIEIIQQDGNVLDGWNYTPPKKAQKVKKVAKVMSFQEQVEKLKKGFAGPSE